MLDLDAICYHPAYILKLQKRSARHEIGHHVMLMELSNMDLADKVGKRYVKSLCWSF